MICFFCATPYHIILSFILKETHFKNKNADLVIYNHFSDAKNIYLRIKKTNKFKKVYFFDENNINILNKFKRLFHSFFPSKIMRYIAHNSSYSEIIFFALDFLNIGYIIKNHHQIRSKCVFSYGEDGIGTYLDPSTYSPNKYLDILLVILQRKSYLKKINSLYTLAPELLQYNIKDNIKQIQLYSDNDILEYCKNNVWRESKKTNLRQVIYIQQPFSDDLSINISKIEQEILNLCKNTFYNDFIIKLHPRTLKFNYFYKYILRIDIPFECLISGSDIESMIIISFLSTAAITPGLLYKRSPYLIFVYKLLSDECPFFDKHITSFINRINQIENYKGKIFIPQDIKEFNEIITNLRQKIKSQKYEK